MTETVIYFLIGFVACFILDRLMLWRFKKDYQQIAELKKSLASNHLDFVVSIGKLREDIHKLRNFLTAQAGESPKKVTADPDFNPHPYSAKYERFSDTEIEDARELMTTKQRKSIGG